MPQSGVGGTCGGAFDRHAAAVARRLADARASGAALRAGPGSVTWTVNREAVVVAGWGRAILLQLAHPKVAAGVAEHSTFRGRPLAGFARFFSTVGAMLSLTFGDEEQMIAAAAGINVIHDRVSGRLPAAAGSFASGDAYSAHDPGLLGWVHATLLESIPLTYELLVAPLTPEQRDRYCAEAALMEPLLGIPAGQLPRRADDLERYMRGMLAGKELAVTDSARTLAGAILYPRFSGILWPAFRPLRLLTIGTLPPALREAYGFRWGPREERALRRWVGALRAVRRALPPAMREWPAARRSPAVEAAGLRR